MKARRPPRTVHVTPASYSHTHDLKKLPQAEVATVEKLITQCNEEGGKLTYRCLLEDCKTPEKRFMSKENARVHVQHELGYKSLFACTGCPAKFSSKDTAKRHCNVKTAGRQYACQYCGARFERKDYRSAHENNQKCDPHRRLLEERVREAATVTLVEVASYRSHSNLTPYHASSPISSGPSSPSTPVSPMTPVELTYPTTYIPPAQPVPSESVMHGVKHEYHYPGQPTQPGILEPYVGLQTLPYYEQSYQRVEQPVRMPPTLYYNQPFVDNTSRNVDLSGLDRTTAFYTIYDLSIPDRYYRTM